jgi:hypothetical protein
MIAGFSVASSDWLEPRTGFLSIKVLRAPSVTEELADMADGMDGFDVDWEMVELS